MTQPYSYRDIASLIDYAILSPAATAPRGKRGGTPLRGVIIRESMHRQYDLLLELARRGVRRNPSGAFAGRACGCRLRSEGADGSHGNASGHLYIASAQRRCRRAQEGRLLGRAHRATQADYAVERHGCDPLSREVVGIS